MHQMRLFIYLFIYCFYKHYDYGYYSKYIIDKFNFDEYHETYNIYL